MSFDTAKNFVYRLHGKTLRLWRYRRTPAKDTDTEGRISTSGWHSIIYPDETITNGLRIEYTAINKPFVQEDPDSNSSLTEVTNPTESTHINLNRMLSLAVVDYVKAHLAEREGNLQAKEYFMREFFNKLADNESNKNHAYVAQAVSPYAVK
tara:strand:- start:162 stop:617 length:456 start_codon:yes stop_codon:yes gene_type:complete